MGANETGVCVYHKVCVVHNECEWNRCLCVSVHTSHRVVLLLVQNKVMFVLTELFYTYSLLSIIRFDSQLLMTND